MPGPANAVVHPVVEYAPDPHGGWLFSSLTRAIGQGINGAPPVSPSSPTYYGVVARELQRFRGAAGLGAAQIYARRSPQMVDQRSDASSATAAIFASRMARGQ